MPQGQLALPIDPIQTVMWGTPWWDCLNTQFIKTVVTFVSERDLQYASQPVLPPHVTHLNGFVLSTEAPPHQQREIYQQWLAATHGVLLTTHGQWLTTLSANPLPDWQQNVLWLHYPLNPAQSAKAEHATELWHGALQLVQPFMLESPCPETLKPTLQERLSHFYLMLHPVWTDYQKVRHLQQHYLTHNQLSLLVFPSQAALNAREAALKRHRIAWQLAVELEKPHRNGLFVLSEAQLPYLPWHLLAADSSNIIFWGMPHSINNILQVVMRHAAPFGQHSVISCLATVEDYASQKQNTAQVKTLKQAKQWLWNARLCIRQQLAQNWQLSPDNIPACGACWGCQQKSFSTQWWNCIWHAAEMM